MAISFQFEDANFEFSDPEKVENWIIKTIETEKCFTGNVTYIFCSDSYLLDVNRKYLNHDYFTDVITFDYVKNSKISGDIFISIDRITEDAKIFNVSRENELLRVMIHGVLHLIGYDDQTDEQEEEIHKKEDFYLNIYNSL
ncbi:MAG: rRNA maturation RNase YbeY [Bacteroidales bacterium]|nr:rRNA maturation RNase YbeY [Bacteroidales bacterium]